MRQTNVALTLPARPAGALPRERVAGGAVEAGALVAAVVAPLARGTSWKRDKKRDRKRMCVCDPRTRLQTSDALVPPLPPLFFFLFCPLFFPLRFLPDPMTQKSIPSIISHRLLFSPPGCKNAG